MGDMRDHFQVGDLVEVVFDCELKGMRGRIERFDEMGGATVPRVSPIAWTRPSSFKLIGRAGATAPASVAPISGDISGSALIPLGSAAASGLETDLACLREERQRIERQLTELRNDLDFANAELKRERHARILAEDELRREKARRR